MSSWVVTKQLVCQEALDLAQFLNAVQVWVIKPQVVNKHWCGSKIHYVNHINKLVTSFDPVLLQKDFYVRRDEPVETLNDYVMSLLSEEQDIGGANDVVDKVNITLRDIIPKSLNKDAKTVRELVVADPTTATVTFIPLVEFNSDFTNKQPPSGHAYRIRQQNGYITMEINSDNHDELAEAMIPNFTTEQTTFLNFQLLPKIVYWAQSVSSKSTEASSLTLIPIDEYSRTYNRLKKVYGQNLVAIWPETTDPLKFVYEDCAIAAYLITLWNTGYELDARRKQSFVDLGCGNGLLVYILSGEGHRGLGLDVRRRKIWNLLGDKADLREAPVVPSDKMLFPDYDWIIGNHSDELTPWIPVMAARSSYTTKYFVLPCCHHDFQNKFNERQQGLSSYRCYLKFVKRVGQVCGFNVEEDHLRIPSTKKVCFVGRARAYLQENQTDINDQITTFIASRCKRNRAREDQGKSDRISDKVTDKAWAADFKARSNTEATRNCTLVDKAVTSQIIHTVFDAVFTASETFDDLVLSQKTPTTAVYESKAHEGDIHGIIDKEKNDVNGTLKKKEIESTTIHASVKENDTAVTYRSNWRRGGTILLGDVVKLFNNDILQQLKKECGGIQTLLKNHHYIFRVSGGKVSLRHPGELQPRLTKKHKRPDSADKLQKTKLCWFNDNHPDGCPLDAGKCSFAHGQNDLKTVTPVARGEK